VTELVPLSQNILAARSPFSNGIQLNNFVSYKPGQGGSNRMGTLENEPIIRKMYAEELDQHIHPMKHKAYQELIMTVIIERYRAIKWIKNLRRRDGDHKVSSSASNCVSSKSSQYIKIHVPMQEWLTTRFDLYLVRLLDTKCLTHCPHLILTTHS